MVRIFPGNARVRGNSSLIPGSGRFPAEGNGNHSNILAWEIPWTEEHGVLQSMGLQKVWIRPNNNYNNILHLLTYSCNAGDLGLIPGLGRSAGEKG